MSAHELLEPPGGNVRPLALNAGVRVVQERPSPEISENVVSDGVMDGSVSEQRGVDPPPFRILNKELGVCARSPLLLFQLVAEREQVLLTVLLELDRVFALMFAFAAELVCSVERRERADFRV